MQTQIVIDEYLKVHWQELRDQLVRDGLMQNAKPVVSEIQSCAEQDAAQLKKLLGLANAKALCQIIQQTVIHHNRCTVMYWVTFYLNATCGEHGCWAYRCYVDESVFTVYCEKLGECLSE